MVVTPDFGGLITNTLTVASFTPDPNSANNSATNVTTVQRPARYHRSTEQPDRDRRHECNLPGRRRRHGAAGLPMAL